jgi:hypothetical protein
VGKRGHDKEQELILFTMETEQKSSIGNDLLYTTE